MSGLSRTPGKRVGVNSPPRVRIPLSPPVVFTDVFQRSKPVDSEPLFITIRGFLFVRASLSQGAPAKPFVYAERSDWDGPQGKYQGQSPSYWQGKGRRRPPESERFGAARGLHRTHSQKKLMRKSKKASSVSYWLF